MSTLYHQLQGLYTAGDVLSAIDCVRALPEWRHVLFVSRDDSFEEGILALVNGLGASVRRAAIVTEADLVSDLRAVLFHCVGHDDSARGEYVRFRGEPPGVTLCAWLHTPGLCGGWSERYNFLQGRGLSTIICNSSFTLHNTPGIDLAAFSRRAIVNPRIDAARYGAVDRRADDGFRIGRWSRADDVKYSDDFLDLMASIDIPEVEFLCMGIPPKFRDRLETVPRARFVENGAMPVEELLSRLDVLLFKTDAERWHEGWCRTVTEAMAAGVIPVVENRGGITDQIVHGHNGFLCDDNAAFRRCCELLYRDPALRARVSANCRAFAAANFDLAGLRADLLALLAPSEPPARLNLGCGFDIRPGYVNFDTRPLPGVDVIGTVDPFHPRLPFPDEAFDEILAYHVLEHVANKPAIIEEIWRIARQNAVIRIKLPDRAHKDAFLDPTHFSLWDVDTIDFYLPGHLRSYYSRAKFGLLGKHTTSREIFWELLAIRRSDAPASPADAPCAQM